jgi:hypothetical protein
VVLEVAMRSQIAHEPSKRDEAGEQDDYGGGFSGNHWTLLFAVTRSGAG